MGSNGRLVIPASLRKELGLTEGGPVVIEAVGDELRVRSIADVVSSAQRRVREYTAANGSVADELISDRRAEAEAECE
ncbi:MAG: AbrB/MazE/SpoVT family DNA-binding domain-containing protein [Pseudomonadota bacterium]